MRDRNADILKYLIENNGEELSMLAIARAMKMDYKNVFAIVKRLEKEQIVALKKFGASSRVELNKAVHPLVFEAECTRRKEILKNKNILVMLRRIRSGLKSELYVLLLFGSYAKKTQTKSSDMDLMFIVPDGMEEKFEKKTHDVFSMLPLPIHHFVFSESQFLGMVDSKEFTVGKEAAKNNIILHGIENYYEMISSDR